MRIVEKYSHLNGEENLMIHHSELYKEIKETIALVDAMCHKTYVSKDKKCPGILQYYPLAINNDFKSRFNNLGWRESRYNYCVTTDYSLMEKLIPLSFDEQKSLLKNMGIENPITSYKQTDFLKDNVAVEVQFGKYCFVAYDLFVKHMLFFSGHEIDVGVEILPVKEMQNEIYSGVAYYEGEVYNLLRHGRKEPGVPMLILGIAP